MKKFFGIRKARRSLFLACAFAPVFLGALMEARGPAKQQSSPRNDIAIINKTRTLEVSLQRTELNHLIVLVKNVSAKDLNGYVVSLNDGRITVDISSGDRVVSPGQTDDLEIPISSSPPAVTVLAAMFADGSIDADQVITAELKQWRIGLKKQLIRALSVLDATLGSADADAATGLDRLESQFSSLPLESDAANPHSAGGSQDAKNTLSSEIQVLRERRQRNGVLMQRQRLLDLRGRIQRRIASL